MWLQTQDISWAYDREHLYGNYHAQNFNDEPQYRGGGTITQNVSQSENLLVWMKPAAYHTFKKLYGRIDQPLTAGGLGTRLLFADEDYLLGSLGEPQLDLSQVLRVGCVMDRLLAKGASVLGRGHQLSCKDETMH